MKTNTPVEVGGKMKFYPSEIILLESDVNYTRLYLADGRTVIVSITLGRLAQRFASCNFFRTHKSYMVNLQYVAVTHIQHQVTLRMTNDVEVSVSRRKKVSLFKILSLKKTKHEKSIYLHS